MRILNDNMMLTGKFLGTYSLEDFRNKKKTKKHKRTSTINANQLNIKKVGSYLK